MILTIITVILIFSILGLARHFNRRVGRLEAEKTIIIQQHQQLERMLYEAVNYDKRPSAVAKRLHDSQF